MAKKTDITDDERQLFRQAMTNIQPIHHKDIVTKPKISDAPLPATKKQQWAIDGRGYFHSHGLQKRILRQLKSGQLKFDAKIDLHGYRLHEAEEVMVQFLVTAQQRKWRLVLIIHGKGWKTENQIGKIKQWLFNWLPEQSGVLAWQSAIAKDGGSGAGYLLLKTAETGG